MIGSYFYEWAENVLRPRIKNQNAESLFPVT